MRKSKVEKSQPDEKEMREITCTKCGKNAKVPVKLKTRRCDECRKKAMQAYSAGAVQAELKEKNTSHLRVCIDCFKKYVSKDMCMRCPSCDKKYRQNIPRATVSSLNSHLVKNN